MKQFFAPLTEPLGVIWLLMALSVIWLLLRRQWRSALWLGIPTVLLFLIGSTSVAESLVAAEERPWASVLRLPSSVSRRTDAPAADAVVALGGGDRISQHDALGFAIYDGGSRLLTAIELVRSGRAKTLVLGGSWPLPSNPRLPSMSVVQAWVASWELASGGMTNLGICLTTHDEALAFKKLQESQGWRSALLVTSALHMRRSEALFKKQGIEVTPVAADFEVCGVPQEMPFSPFPRQWRFYLFSLYMHEKIGWWVYRGRGWV
jgi:uncharacterized SAM-binding protein YcdF (DUF218 family)